MSDNKLKRVFEWEEKIPKIGKKGYLFHDQIFVIKVESYKIIKISMSLKYDFPKKMYYYHLKAIEGVEFLSGLVDMRFKYSLNDEMQGTWSGKSVSLKKLKKTYILQAILQSSSHFNSIFVKGNVGRKVTYALSIEFELKNEDPSSKNYLKMHELLFMEKDLSDIKLICEEKTFQCHKIVLSCQSDVFKAMFKSGTKMVESESGEVKIKDVKVETLETMIYFIYHDKVMDEKMINSDLLILADRYNVRPLKASCVEYLAQNLSLENAIDVLISAHLTNQETLFNVAKNFVWDNKKNPVIINSWKEVEENDTNLVNKITKAMLSLE